jgi:translation initiation factor 2 beta subunit (eIF-2beta)/eIF-5
MNKYNPELVKFLAEHLQSSKVEAEEYISLLIRDKFGRNRLVELLKKYGHTDKEIKKLLK